MEEKISTREFWKLRHEKVEERNKILKKPGKGPRPWPKVYNNHKNDFFERAASRVSYLNKEIVMEVYGELMRTLMADLRVNKFAFLPDLGKFRVTVHPPRLQPRKYHNLPATDKRSQMKPVIGPESYALRFSLDKKVRAYVRSLKERDEIMEAEQKKI